jgi:importin-7
VLVNAVLYNPSAALQIMESFRAGAATQFFDTWFASIREADKRLPRVHDKKLSILALCALLELSPAEIPENLHKGWPGIISGVLKLFKDLPKAIEGKFRILFWGQERSFTDKIAARKALEESFQDDEDDDESQLFNLDDDDGKCAVSLCPLVF